MMYRLLLIALVLVLGACADGVLGRAGGQGNNNNVPDGNLNNEQQEPEPPAAVDLDSPEQTLVPVPDDTTFAPPIDDRNILEIIGRADVGMNYINNTTLEVRLVDANGDVVRGSDITFEFEGNVQDMELSPASAPTNRDGLARTTVTSGTTRGAYRLKVSAFHAEPVFFNIRVEPKDNAAYVVHTEYSGTTLPALVSVRLFNATTRCEDLDPTALPPALDTFDVLPEPDSIPDARFVNLPNGVGYTVVSMGLIADEARAAWGCNDEAPLIQNGFDTEVTVQMDEIRPRLEGTFDIETRVDLTDALPEPWRTNINIIGQLFTDPASLVVDLLLGDENDPNDDGLIGNVLNIIPGIRGLLTQVIDSFLQGVLPPEVQRVFAIGGEVYETVTQFTLGGQLEFTADPDSQGFLADVNHHRYGQIIIDWDLDCGVNDPPECGRIVLGTERLQQFGALSGDFTGLLVGTAEGDRLMIDRHSFTFNYGALLLALFEELILPEIFGPQVNTLGEAIGTLFDCREIADDLFDPQQDFLLNEVVFNGCTEALGEFEGMLVDLIVGNAQDFPALTMGTFEADSEGEIIAYGCAVEEPAPYAPGQFERYFDTLGAAEARCQWDARLDAGNEVRPLTADFFGARQQP